MKWIGIILVSIAIVGTIWLCWPKKAHCIYCFTGTCYNSMICGSGCVCMTTNGISGKCVSFK